MIQKKGLGDCNSFRVLSSVLVLGTGVYLKTNRLSAALTSVGNHTEDGVLKNLLRVVTTEFGGGGYNLIANVACVAGVNLSALLVAGENNFVSVYNDNIVTTVNVGGEDCLVLSTQQVGSLYGNLAEYLVGGLALPRNPQEYRVMAKETAEWP